MIHFRVFNINGNSNFWKSKDPAFEARNSKISFTTLATSDTRFICITKFEVINNLVINNTYLQILNFPLKVFLSFKNGWKCVQLRSQNVFIKISLVKLSKFQSIIALELHIEKKLNSDSLLNSATTWCGHVPTSTCPQARLRLDEKEKSDRFTDFLFDRC